MQPNNAGRRVRQLGPHYGLEVRLIRWDLTLLRIHNWICGGDEERQELKLAVERYIRLNNRASRVRQPADDTK
jgi:hypothetical protein